MAIKDKHLKMYLEFEIPHKLNYMLFMARH